MTRHWLVMETDGQGARAPMSPGWPVQADTFPRLV